MNANRNIIVLSKDKKVLLEIKNKLGDRFNIIKENFEITSLMMSIYKLDPILIIIDFDEYDYMSFKLIKSMEADNYIPLIAIYSDINLNLGCEEEMEYFLYKPDIKLYLGKYLKIFADFKDKYNNIKENYYVNNLINSETDLYLKKYINNDMFFADPLENTLNNIFNPQNFLINMPASILIAYKNDNKTYLDLYKYRNNTLIKDKKPIIIANGSSVYGIHNEMDNAFFMNYDQDEYSDIDSQKIFFEKEILERVKNIRNFAGYMSSDTAIICINYDSTVSHFEAELVKELCVNYNLIKNIFNQMNNVKEAFKYTIDALSRAAEENDNDTGMHIFRVNAYSKYIAENLGMDKKYVEQMQFFAQMHDVGKIAIPQSILRKPGQLNTYEIDIMKTHSFMGARIIGDSPQLNMAADIAISHHEKYDGTGYPYGLKGEEIPLCGRIVTLGDIYDALRSKRSYKGAFTHEDVYKIITKGDGRVMPYHFDPGVLNVFEKHHLDFKDIYKKLSDKK